MQVFRKKKERMDSHFRGNDIWGSGNDIWGNGNDRSLGRMRLNDIKEIMRLPRFLRKRNDKGKGGFSELNLYIYFLFYLLSSILHHYHHIHLDLPIQCFLFYD
jgi:hypothetical protein